SHLKDKEGYLGFKISVLDKAGNERQVEFVDDGYQLIQKSPAFVQNTICESNPSFQCDPLNIPSSRLEIIKGEKLDTIDGNFLIVDGSVFFEASNLDQIISEVDQNGINRIDGEGSEECNPGYKKSNFNLFGQTDQEVAVFENCQINGTVSDGNDGQIPATYLVTIIFGSYAGEIVAIYINPTMSLEEANEEGWIDVISNHLSINNSTNPYLSFFKTENPSGFRARIDTKLPDVIELAFHS
ncbi:MAG: hypothetical protein VXV73_06880, partial [Actinomycetota bacterium]|nr:hypothetical protein [Actinomycetota bacterium]